jgi:predicted O-methyltransferase YrrM
MKRLFKLSVVLTGMAAAILTEAAMHGTATQNDRSAVLDEQVTAFLKKMQYQWRDMNVPEADGKTLYDNIVKSKYKAALEIGTSTGHSGIWMGWAMSKTGGKLITIEIDEDRYKQAVANFKEAGVSPYVDARLADAHTLVNQLPGPFDFVFLDADKDWYTNYAKTVIPKLTANGCIAAHNVRGGGSAGWRGGGGTGEYYDYMMSRADFATSLVEGSPAGLALSCRKGAK